MNKLEKTNKTYEELVNKYLQAKSQAQIALIQYADIIAEALNELKKKKWLEWLSDERIGLNKSQAYKFVALSEHCKKSVQLTGLLKSNQVEKAYLLTKVKDPEYQKELAEQIIDAEYTVKQTKQIVSKVKNENKSPSEAIAEVKNHPELPAIRNERKTVPIEEFNNLKADYEKLLKEKQELEDKLKEHLNSESKKSKAKLMPENQTISENHILKEPIKSDLPDYTLNKQKRSVVIKGYELPIPVGIKIEEQAMDYIKIGAINNAKNYHNLDLS